MTRKQKSEVYHLRIIGVSASDIASQLGLSVNTVRSYFFRHPLERSQTACPVCGEPIFSLLKRKPRRFCSDACRMKWWNRHPTASHICIFCGKEFKSNGKNAKYCSRECYYSARRGEPIHTGQFAHVPHKPGPIRDACEAGRPHEE